MLHDKIKLTSNESFITTYIPSTYESFSKDKLFPLVVICPGGGYGHLSDREAEPVALKLNSLGFAAAVLTYTLAPMKAGDALNDLKAAVRYCRENAESLHIDSQKIIAGGFSAGAHLAASLGVYYQEKIYRPDYMMLCYPVITSDIRYSHASSIENVCGTDKKWSPQDVSLELHVTKDFPSTFMWHTNADESVPAENSLLFADALRKAGVDLEYHLFSRGSHGLALATKESSKPDGSNIQMECAVWPELFAAWAKEQGIL